MENTANIKASPLTWPHWIPRTSPYDRAFGRFGKKGARGYGIDKLTVAEGTRRVMEQIRAYTQHGRSWRADPDEVIISTNLQLRMDGFPKSNQSEPADPGVAVYFILDGEPRCVPCDSYIRVADNLAGAAATIEALRAIERHGSNMHRAAYTGFTGLPSPDQVSATTWREILNYHGSDLSECKQAYRRAASKAHPDNGGSDDALHRVSVAWEQAQVALT